MYNRYGDISKFIIDMEQLCIADDGYVYISKEEDFGIAVDMESSYGSLDEVKPFSKAYWGIGQSSSTLQPEKKD